jgi:hypothetical protein
LADAHKVINKSRAKKARIVFPPNELFGNEVMLRWIGFSSASRGLRNGFLGLWSRHMAVIKPPSR